MYNFRWTLVAQKIENISIPRFSDKTFLYQGLMTPEEFNYSTVLTVYMHNFVSNTVAAKTYLNETGIFLPLSQLGDHLSRFSGGRCALVVCATTIAPVSSTSTVNNQVSAINISHMFFTIFKTHIIVIVICASLTRLI